MKKLIFQLSFFICTFQLITASSEGINASPLGVLGGPATISASGPTQFCAGNNVTLTASPGASYLWSNGATTQSIMVNQSGNYVVTVTYADNTSAVSSPMNVNVNPSPTATISYNGPSTFCEGSSTTLYSSFGNSYLWSTGATTQNITVNQTGDYIVTVTNGFNCTAVSAPTYITVNSAPPTTITSSGPLSFCENDSVVLTAPPDAFYMWNTGEGTQSIVVNQTGSYSVTVISWDNCYGTSSPVLVVSNPLPSNQVSILGNTTFCEGQSSMLSASGGVSYLWNNGSTSNMIYADSTGSYVVTVTDANNCSNTSNPILITVVEETEIDWELPDSICRGQSISLTATPEGGSFIGNGVVGNTLNTSNLTLGVITLNYLYNDGICISEESIEIDVVDCSAGFETIDESEVKVYPNPFTEFIQVDTHLKWKSIQLLNIHGQILNTINYSTGAFIDLGIELISGVYFLRFHLEDGKTFTKSILRN